MFRTWDAWAGTRGRGTWGRGTWGRRDMGLGDGDAGMRKRRLSFLRRMCKIQFPVLFFDSFTGKHKNKG